MFMGAWFFIVAGWYVTIVTGCCPDNWVAFSGSCYEFGETLQLNWTQGTVLYQAQYSTSGYNLFYDNVAWEIGLTHHCANQTATMVTIQTMEEMVFLKQFAKRLKTTAQYNFFWIGGNDNAAKGTYVWYTNNSQVSNTAVTWHPGEPSDSTAEHCMLLWDIFNYNVGNYMCGSKGHVICEKSMTSAHHSAIPVG